MHSKRVDEGMTMRRRLGATSRERLPQRIVRLLREAGELADRLGMPAYVVGGFVRDYLRGHPNLDLDLVVEGDGLKFARALAKQCHARVKSHERFMTASIILRDGFKLDIATARTEWYESPATLPTVQPGSIRDDLHRRDFTINTLAISLNSRTFWRLLDLYGGQRDIEERAIRVLNSRSFIDDPTRIFRAVRFELRLGFRISHETLAFINKAIQQKSIDRLSGPRLFGELRRLLSEREPRSALCRLAELDVLRFIHPKLAWSRRLDGVLKKVEGSLDWYTQRYPARKIERWLPYVMAFMEVLPRRAVAEALKRLGVGESESTCIRAGRFEVGKLTRRLSRRPQPRPADTYRTVSRFADVVLVYLMAMNKSRAIKPQLTAYFDMVQQAKPMITGADLKTMGLKAGPRFTRILSRLRDARLNGEVRTEAEERAMARRFVVRTRTF